MLMPIGRKSLSKPRNRFDQTGTGMSIRSDIYARPDIYDMEYEGASNSDARFFARLLARVRPRRVLALACGSGRVTFTLAAALPMGTRRVADEVQALNAEESSTHSGEAPPTPVR
jgi:ubiquinone/menaquinone biosynthesis C-methylase UbiE